MNLIPINFREKLSRIDDHWSPKVIAELNFERWRRQNNQQYSFDCLFSKGYNSSGRSLAETGRMEGTPSKAERLAEFFRRLGKAGAASSFDEGYRLLCFTLDLVEDEMSGLPNEPERWMTLDRMFPPQSDRMSSVEGFDVKRFDNLRHITYIAANGAIEIRSRRRRNGAIEIHFSKAGSDGQSISDFCPKLANDNL